MAIVLLYIVIFFVSKFQCIISLGIFYLKIGRSKMAKLFFRYGVMNSGKTTNLLQVAHNYEEHGMRVILMKVKADTKGADYVLSRLGIKRKVDFLVDNNDNIKEMILAEHKKNPIHCILVDEAQFLNKQHCDDLLAIVIHHNIPVICYGLRTDFRREAFEGSSRLMMLAHTIEELKTVCKCGKKAIFNARKINGKYTRDGNQLAIDGVDEMSYESFCGTCYEELFE